MIRKRACVAATGLMAGRTGGLSEAKRLQLEHHLDHCSDCAADERDLYRLIVGTGAAEMPLLGERARARAIAGALQSTERPRVTTSTPQPWLRWAVPATALAAAAAALLWVVATGDRSGVGPALADSRLVFGDLATASGPVAAGQLLDYETELTTRDGARLQLAHATITLSSDTTVEWSAASSTLTLTDGVVRASVDPKPRQPFRVATDEFSVEVLGTEFEVTNDSVTVYEGRVRVVGEDGEVMIEELGAGEAWHVPEELARRPKPKRSKRRAKRAPVEQLDATELIDRARTHLASRDVEDARKVLAEALAVATTATQKAEARSLLAECALVEGEHDKAVDLYLRVADRYRKMRAGETALFAAARIEARQQRTAAARRLLERYLERYPDGRFVDEATRRLDELE